MGAKRSDFSCISKIDPWEVGTETSTNGFFVVSIYRVCPDCGIEHGVSVGGLDKFVLWQCNTLFDGCGKIIRVPDNVFAIASRRVSDELDKAAEIRAAHGGPSQWIVDC